MSCWHLLQQCVFLRVQTWAWFATHSDGVGWCCLRLSSLLLLMSQHQWTSDLPLSSHPTALSNSNLPGASIQTVLMNYLGVLSIYKNLEEVGLAGLPAVHRKVWEVKRHCQLSTDEPSLCPLQQPWKENPEAIVSCIWIWSHFCSSCMS